MIVDNAIYVDGRRTAESHTLHETYEACREQHGVAWIGLYKPTEEEFTATVRHGEAPDLKSVRRRMEQEPDLLRRGSEAILHAILDLVVDDYGSVVEGLENDIDGIEPRSSAAPERLAAYLPALARGRRVSAGYEASGRHGPGGEKVPARRAGPRPAGPRSR